MLRKKCNLCRQPGVASRLPREVTASFPADTHHSTGHDLEQADVIELAFYKITAEGPFQPT